MPEQTSTPLGQRFSHVYHPKERIQQDSGRMRRRIAAFLQEHAKFIDDLPTTIRSEIGIDVPYRGNGRHGWEEYCRDIEIADLFDTIPFVFKCLMNRGLDPTALIFVRFVDRVFREEGISFRADLEGGIHYFVDEEFEVSRSATISSLGAPRYYAAKEAFERAHRSLDQHPIDTLGAVRGVFDTVETVFKLIADGKAARIGPGEINNILRPLLNQRYSEPAVDAAGRLLSSLGDWVNSAHQYRHSPGLPQPAPPPTELAIMLLGSGAAFARWLAELDQTGEAQRV